MLKLPQRHVARVVLHCRKMGLMNGMDQAQARMRACCTQRARSAAARSAWTSAATTGRGMLQCQNLLN